MPKTPQAKILDSKIIYKTSNGLFALKNYTIRFDRHDGGTLDVERLVFERGKTVCVLPYDPVRDEVVLINEVRPAMMVNGDNPFCPALPAGIVDAGETALQAAARELKEEANLICKDIRLVHAGAYVSPGGTSEKTALAVAIVDTTAAGGIHGKVEEGESIKTEVVSSREFIRRVDSGEISSLSTISMAYWFAAHKKDLRPNAVARAFHHVKNYAQKMVFG